MADTPSFLTERLQSEGEKALAFFRNLSAAQWEQIIYSREQPNEEGDGWRARDLLAHFVVVEENFARLIANVAEGGPGAPPDFDIESFNQSTVAEAGLLPTAVLLQNFGEARQQTVRLVASLTVDDLAKVGRHPFLGQIALGEMIKLIYRHNQLHLRDLRRIVPLNWGS
jgi:hypothetical protein